jgi:OOP family OmpA-OmpF porin
MHRVAIGASSIVLFVLSATTVFAADGNKAQAKGMIISRTSETLVVKGSQGNVTVVLDDNTETRDNRGLFGLGKQRMSDAVLIPGLKVDVNGQSDDQGRVVAKTITVDGDDLETAEMIQAGLHPTAEQVIANERSIAQTNQDLAATRQEIGLAKQNSDASLAAHKRLIEKSMKDIEEATNRFLALREYDVKGNETVTFPVSSSTVSAEDQEKLKELSQRFSSLDGYIVEVTGYADSTGTAMMNQQLSEDRAKAVVAYLIQQCGVPVHRVVAPGAMGIYQPTATNETPEGRAQNRRVEVKYMINKAVAGN